MLLTILVFLLILSVLVLIHEWGHFFVAKKLGIKVEEFGFGFPPRAFGIKKGETIYSINWLPIGGFVKLYGEDEAGGGKIRISKSEIRNNKENLNRAFFAKSPWQRTLVVVAGVVMNSLLAIVIFYIFLAMSDYKTQLPLLTDHKFFGVSQVNSKDVIISSIAKNSPAQKAGLKPLIKIISVNNKEIKDIKEFTDIINRNKGTEVTIKWRDLQTNSVSEAKITPRVSPPKNEGALGIVLFSVSTANLSYATPIQKFFSGITHPINLMVYNLDVMGDLIRVSFEKKTAEPLSQGVAGPIGIASVTGSILQIPTLKEKVLGLLNLTGLLSVSLAFFNILPIPALDGGRLFFILVEGILGKKINQKTESLIHTIGMAILLGLMVLITFKDIEKLFFGFFQMP